MRQLATAVLGLISVLFLLSVGVEGMQHSPLSPVAPMMSLLEEKVTQFPPEDPPGEATTCGFSCKTCVFVLERLKKHGPSTLPSSICSEMMFKFPEQYPCCKEVMNHLAINGNNIRYWLYHGCYMHEKYLTKEWLNPCPSHVICNTMRSVDNKPFCQALEVQDPFGGE